VTVAPDLTRYTDQEIAWALHGLGVARMYKALAALEPLLEAEARNRPLAAWTSPFNENTPATLI